MFSFFTKNEYLVDHLAGFIDIHNHILPGIDDGAKDVEESIALIKAFGEFGVDRFICTPHIMQDYHDNTPKSIKKAYKSLKKELKAQNLWNHISIDYAAEHMIDANFGNLLDKDKIMPLGKNHILIEMSYLQPSINFDSAVHGIVDKQLFPVFAHPERYGYLHNYFGKYQDYKNKGIKFQLNMLSLGDYYGTEINKIALKLLDSNMYEFIGSDVHNHRHLEQLKKVRISSKVLNSLQPVLNETITTFL